MPRRGSRIRPGATSEPVRHRAAVVRIYCQDDARTRSIGSGVLGPLGQTDRRADGPARGPGRQEDHRRTPHQADALRPRAEGGRGLGLRRVGVGRPARGRRAGRGGVRRGGHAARGQPSGVVRLRTRRTSWPATPGCFWATSDRRRPKTARTIGWRFPATPAAAIRAVRSSTSRAMWWACFGEPTASTSSASRRGGSTSCWMRRFPTEVEQKAFVLLSVVRAQADAALARSRART